MRLPALVMERLLVAVGPAGGQTTARAQVLPDSLARCRKRAYFTLARVSATARRATSTQDLAADLPPLWRPGSIRAGWAAGALACRSYAAQRGLVACYFAEHWNY